MFKTDIFPFNKGKQAKLATNLVEEYNAERRKLVDEYVSYLKDHIISTITEAARVHGKNSIIIALNNVKNEFESKCEERKSYIKMTQGECAVAVDRLIKYLEDEEFTYELKNESATGDTSELYVTWPMPS